MPVLRSWWVNLPAGVMRGGDGGGTVFCRCTPTSSGADRMSSAPSPSPFRSREWCLPASGSGYSGAARGASREGTTSRMPRASTIELWAPSATRIAIRRRAAERLISTMLAMRMPWLSEGYMAADRSQSADGSWVRSVPPIGYILCCQSALKASFTDLLAAVDASFNMSFSRQRVSAPRQREL